MSEYFAEKIRSLALANFEEIRDCRRHLHQHPELSFQEFETSAFIQKKLMEYGIPVSYTHLRAHETVLDLVCRLLLEKKNILYFSTHPSLILTIPSRTKHSISYHLVHHSS